MEKIKMANSKQVYFKIYSLIALIIFLIALIIIFNDKNNSNKADTLIDDDVEIVVDDGPQAGVENEPVKDSQDNSNNPQTGPATVEDLGGSNGLSNIEDLLDGKDIEIEK